MHQNPSSTTRTTAPPSPAFKTCGDVMSSDIVCCLTTDSAKDVAIQMKESDIGCVPIVDNHVAKKLVGIVTDRDLVVAVVAKGTSPEETKMASLVNRDVITCHGSDSIEHALDAMTQRQVRRIPVVDAQGCVVGIISQGDLATRAETPLRVGQLVEEISKPTGSAVVDRKPRPAPNAIVNPGR